MGQRQSHRGCHPEDGRLFGAKWGPILRAAVSDVSYLLSRDYSSGGALKLVGDHFQLDVRQRTAVERSACSDCSLVYRRAHHVSPQRLVERDIAVDGYNLLITTECALSGGVLLVCRDGCVRDIASVHGSYRKVEETLPAIRMIGETLATLAVGNVHWYWDSPVSNSGRLRTLVLDEARANGWNWTGDVVSNPDSCLVSSDRIIVSSDSWVLDNARHWTNLVWHMVASLECDLFLVDLCDAPETGAV